MKTESGWEITSGKERFQKELPPRPKGSRTKNLLRKIMEPLRGDYKYTENEKEIRKLEDEILRKAEELETRYPPRREWIGNPEVIRENLEGDPHLKLLEIGELKRKLEDLYDKEK